MRFAESVGMRLENRTLQTITIRDPEHKMRVRLSLLERGLGSPHVCAVVD